MWPRDPDPDCESCGHRPDEDPRWNYSKITNIRLMQNPSQFAHRPECVGNTCPILRSVDFATHEVCMPMYWARVGFPASEKYI